MQYSQEHLKTMVYAKFGGQTECIMGNSKIENTLIIKHNKCLFASPIPRYSSLLCNFILFLQKIDFYAKKLHIEIIRVTNRKMP